MALLRAVIRKDLRRILADPMALLLWIGIPLAIGALITLATGGTTGPRPVAHLLVADEDESFVSGLLGGAFANMGDLAKVEQVTQEEGRALLADDEASALLVIPDGFGQALLEETPCELLLLTNPSQRILPGILEEGARIFVDGAFYVHRILGEELREIVAGPADQESFFPDQDIARISVEINQAVQRLEKYLFPPVIQVEMGVVEEDDDGEPAEQVAFGFLFVPGILIMAFFFASQGLADDLWAEREAGTLRRALTTPHGLLVYLGGKWIAGGLVLAAMPLVVLPLGLGYFGVPMTNLGPAILWAAVAGLVLLLFMSLLNLYCSSRRAAQVVGAAVTFPLLMIGGSFFPSEAMPGWMAQVGRLTPNGWSLELLKDLLLARAAPGALTQGYLVAAAAGLVLAWLCTRRARVVYAGDRP